MSRFFLLVIRFPIGLIAFYVWIMIPTWCGVYEHYPEWIRAHPLWLFITLPLSLLYIPMGLTMAFWCAAGRLPQWLNRSSPRLSKQLADSADQIE